MKKHSLKEQAIPSLHFGDAVTPFIAPDVVPFVVVGWHAQFFGGMEGRVLLFKKLQSQSIRVSAVLFW